MNQDQELAEQKIVGSFYDNLLKFIKEASKQKKSVILIGPRGTGKELFAKVYQEGSGKKNFIPVNCAGISDATLLSELFGHEKGAYTGAESKRKGLIEQHKENGILFLDELGDSSQAFQASLLRVLQYGDYKPLGSDKLEKIQGGLQVVAATSKPQEVREDLLDRFECIYLYPLKETPNYIPELIQYFCKGLEAKSISTNALKLLTGYYPWPGNVRELKRTLGTADILCKNRELRLLEIEKKRNGFFGKEIKRRVDRFGGIDKARACNLEPIDFPIIIQYLEMTKISADITNMSPPIKIQTLGGNATAEEAGKFIEVKIYEKDSNWFEQVMRQRKSQEEDIEKQRIINRDTDIATSLTGIEKSLNRISPDNRINHEKELITFDNTTPVEWGEKFWEYHARNNRDGQKLLEKFEGRLAKSTTYNLLRKAKERIKPNS